MSDSLRSCFFWALVFFAVRTPYFFFKHLSKDMRLLGSPRRQYLSVVSYGVSAAATLSGASPDDESRLWSEVVFSSGQTHCCTQYMLVHGACSRGNAAFTSWTNAGYKYLWQVQTSVEVLPRLSRYLFGNLSTTTTRVKNLIHHGKALRTFLFSVYYICLSSNSPMVSLMNKYQ